MKDTTLLERMLDDTFVFKGKHIKVKDWYAEEEKDTIRIITTTDPIVIKNTEVKKFVDQCIRVEETQALQVINKSQEDIGNLKDILMDNIKKVQENKEYINQAKVINNSVNSLMNMVSLQMKINSKR